MDIRTRQLVAIGASVTAHCQPCLQYHLAKARRHAVDPADVEEAIALAKMVRKGARGKMDEFIDGLSRGGDPAADSREDDGCAAAGACCG